MNPAISDGEDEMVFACCTQDTFRPNSFHPVRWLDWEADFPLAAAYWRQELLYKTWLEARFLGYRYAAVVTEGKILSLAAAWTCTGFSAELSAVSTNDPELRRKGYAKSACSFVTAEIVRQGRMATVSTDDDNLGMQRTAESIGYRWVSADEGLRWRAAMQAHLDRCLSQIEQGIEEV
jgi:hypothetical protein